MKKQLLSLGVVALTAFASSADTFTFNFEGEGDVYGMTRINVGAQNNNGVKSELSGKGKTSVEFADNGITVNCGLISGTAGYALVYGTDTSIRPNGLAILNNSEPSIKLTMAEGCEITGVSVDVTGQMLTQTKVYINGVDRSGATLTACTTYAATDLTGGNEATITMSFIQNWSHPRFIHSITVTYTRDLGDKQECGLGFDAETAEGVAGQAFTAPALLNPNNLPVTWSSSNEAVATVDAEGVVTPLAKGTAQIKASFGGNDEFADGYASYTLTVLPSAKNFTEALELAPATRDKVYFDFPLVVTSVTTFGAWTEDPEGNAGYIHNTKNDGVVGAAAYAYNVGAVIPAGWLATRMPVGNDICWYGLPDEPTQPEPELEIPEELVVTLNSESLTVTQEYESYGKYGSEHMISITGDTTEDNVVVTLEVPEGWDGYIGANDLDWNGGGAEPMRKSVELEAMGENTEGMKKGNVFTFPADGDQHMGQYYLYKGDEYASADSIYIMVKAKKTEDFGPSGIESIDAEDAEVRYFNLQGVELSKPEGICVKVVNNKATKVVK